MAYLNCCEYRAPSSADVSSTAKVSADTVLVVRLRFARCSSCHCPDFDALLPKYTAVFTELLHTSESHCTCNHNTSANTSTYEVAASFFEFISRTTRSRVIKMKHKNSHWSAQPNKRLKNTTQNQKQTQNQNQT